MANKLEEITIVFRGEHFRNDEDWMAGQGDKIVDGKPEGMISISGVCEPGDLKYGQTYRIFGRWGEYRNRKTDEVIDQFQFQTLVLETPRSKSGTIAYLADAGKGFNVGRARATKLWEIFGPDASVKARTDPEAVARALKIDLTYAKGLSDKLQSQKKLEAVTIELTGILHGRGFPKTTAAKAIKKWGNEATNVIRKNPFALMAFRGVGFKLCDSMWIDLGNDPHALKRIALLAWYEIASNTDGHTWFPVEKAIDAMAFIADRQLQVKAIRFLKRTGICHFRRIKDSAIAETGELKIADGPKAKSEESLSERIVSAKFEWRKSPYWPDAESIEGIDDHQRQALKQALNGPISILAGGPGTGKTYTASKLIQAVIAKYGLASIAVAAPTGKAAVRISEAMAEHNIRLRASTWHSLLGVEKSPDDDMGGWGFRHNANNRWPLKLIVGDETSMNDTPLTNAILQARAHGCHMLLVGDINQLPPVGHGAPLRDLIRAGLPCGELTEIKRNSGGIVETCAAIREQRPWKADDNLIVTGDRNETDQIESMLQTIRQSERDGLDPIWDCQVIVAVNDKSKLSRKKLNEILQRELNKQPTIKGSPFRLRDKVMNTKNALFKELDSNHEPAADDGEVFVANGEMGSVVDIQPKHYVVRLSAPRRFVKVFRGKEKDGSGCSFVLGYAATCHKLQGSEVPIAITMIDGYTGARRICDRSWLYTAISRAKHKSFLVGQKTIADRMCRVQNIDKRETLLTQLIHLKTAQHLLPTI